MENTMKNMEAILQQLEVAQSSSSNTYGDSASGNCISHISYHEQPFMHGIKVEIPYFDGSGAEDLIFKIHDLFEDPKEALKDVKLTGSVEEYRARFEEISTKCFLLLGQEELEELQIPSTPKIVQLDEEDSVVVSHEISLSALTGQCGVSTIKLSARKICNNTWVKFELEPLSSKKLQHMKLAGGIACLFHLQAVPSKDILLLVREDDHCIHLTKGTSTINVRPYRYPFHEKPEMEKLVTRCFKVPPLPPQTTTTSDDSESVFSHTSPSSILELDTSTSKSPKITNNGGKKEGEEEAEAVIEGNDFENEFAELQIPDLSFLNESPPPLELLVPIIPPDNVVSDNTNLGFDLGWMMFDDFGQSFELDDPFGLKDF
ncbi:ethylene-responsive transcription factor ERF118 [Senna tora]|uniref:Ethylene-responsive transcription factor ERF118 n=1 Tax=Senna tora TaxID=362788 RepID=A0A834SEG7_9FABA|nr:ethylene-responsive transcription factor ERF118 [Senna tora]